MARSRVVVYARISEDRLDEREGVERQVHDCLQLAERKGLEVVEVVEENDTSAWSRKARPGWRHVVDLARREEIDGIVAYATDRLYRRVRDLDELADLVGRRGLHIYTVNAGDIDLNSDDQLAFAYVIAAMAQKESAGTARRIRRAHLQKAAEGKWKGGRRPWGYHRDGVTVYDLEADAIRTVAQDVLLLDMSMKAAATKFNALTEASIYRQPDESGHRASMSNKVLRDVLVGYRVVGKRIHVTQEERSRYALSRTASPTVTPPPWHRPTNVVDAEWPAILSESVWNGLRDKLLHPDGQEVRSKRPELSMLSGLLKCGVCYEERDSDGQRLLVSLGSGSNSYTCGRCGRVGITKPAVERLVEKWVRRALEPHDGDLPASLDDLDPREREQRQSQREKLDEAREQLLRHIALGEVSEAEARTALELNKRERDRLAESDEHDHRLRLRQQEARRLLPQWEEASPAQRRAVIANVADYFIVRRTARSGSKFQPARVAAKWVGEDRLHVLVDNKDETLIDPETWAAGKAERRRASQAAYRERKRQKAHDEARRTGKKLTRG